jgi:hypothetical protein
MSGVFVFLFLLLLLFRKTLMLNPIIRKMSSILFSKESEMLNEEEEVEAEVVDVPTQKSDKKLDDELNFVKEDVHD